MKALWTPCPTHPSLGGASYYSIRFGGFDDGSERRELATVHRVLVATGNPESGCWENDDPNASPNRAEIRNTNRGVRVQARSRDGLRRMTERRNPALFSYGTNTAICRALLGTRGQVQFMLDLASEHKQRRVRASSLRRPRFTGSPGFRGVIRRDHSGGVCRFTCVRRSSMRESGTSPGWFGCGKQSGYDAQRTPSVFDCQERRSLHSRTLLRLCVSWAPHMQNVRNGAQAQESSVSEVVTAGETASILPVAPPSPWVQQGAADLFGVTHG